jgi:twinfilin
MAKAQLHLSSELERAFADAQGGKVRFVKIAIVGEDFTLAAVGAASSDPRRDCAALTAPEAPVLVAGEAAFVLFCLDVNVPALRWVLLAFVPESVGVRDKMLYSSSRESLKKQLGPNYFVGEFHTTELVRVAMT